MADVHDADDPQAVFVALGVAVLALSLIADDRAQPDFRQTVAATALTVLREKYNVTPENT